MDIYDENDFKNALALAQEHTIVSSAAIPQIGEILPDFSLIGNHGELWGSQSVRGKYSLAIVTCNHVSQPLGQVVFNQASPLQAKSIQLVTIGERPQACDSNFAPNLTDTKHYVLPEFPSGLAITCTDMAGFVRRRELLSTVNLTSTLAALTDMTPALAVGKLGPDFSVTDMNGEPRRLSALRGKRNLLLTFFPKCFTGGCTNHLTSLRDKMDQFKANDTDVWAVSVDPADVQIPFAGSWNLGFPLLPDPGRNLCFLYHTVDEIDELSRRQSVLIDKKGIVRYIDSNVNILTHGADMLAKMRELGMISNNKTSSGIPQHQAAPTTAPGRG